MKMNHSIPLGKDQIVDTKQNYGAVEAIAPIPLKVLYDSDSLKVVYFCVLVSETARGLILPTLWLFVRSLGGDRFEQGLAVSCFSFGRIFAAPLIGHLSEVYGYKSILILCNIILAIGALLYASTTTIHGLLFAQLVLGIGAGSLGATRSYVSETTSKAVRTLSLAYLSALQYAGFTVTPIVGAMLAAYLGKWFHSDRVSFMAPAFGLFFLSVSCVFTFFSAFQEIDRNILHHDNHKQRQAQEEEDAEANTVDEGIPLMTAEEETKEEKGEEATLKATKSSGSSNTWLYWQLIFSGCVLNIMTKGTISIFETLLVMFVTSQFHWAELQAGLVLSVCGFVGLVCLLQFGLFLHYFEDVDLIIGGIAVMILSCICLDHLVLPEVTQWRLYLSLVCMFAIGYPIGHTALIGVYSKVLTAGPQGKMLGLFSSCGSLARIVFPTFAGYIVQHYGFAGAFSMASVVLVLCCIYLIVKRKSIISVSNA